MRKAMKKKLAFGRTEDDGQDPSIEEKPTESTAVRLTASFAMEETYKKIQQKIESAERRARQGHKQAKNVTLFEAVQEEVTDFKEPERSASRKEPDQEEAEVIRSRRRGGLQTPQQFLTGEEFEVNQTPSAVGGSNQSKKTRFGSTDEQGNRLSNLPGEMRPSLTSVAPYDDNAETLISKVETLDN